MRIAPQISAASIVALGHFNPLIFTADWLKDKEIVVGNDFDKLKVQIVHPEVVSYQLPWGAFQCDREKVVVSTMREPLVRVYDFFLKCFQLLPETPVSAVGINREVHFSAGSSVAADRIGDELAPKTFWGEFANVNGKKVGGLRSLVMEQAILSTDGNKRLRLDGSPGYIQVKVEASMRRDIPFPIFVQVNNHFDLEKGESKLSDGAAATERVAANFDTSLKDSDAIIDRVMGLALRG
jgi:hypothetical protein